MGNMDKVKKTIYCPQCGRKVMECDESAQIIFSIACRKCNKLVVFNSIDGNISLKRIPPRTTASGMRFYR